MIPNQNAIKNGKAHYSPETRISGPPDSSIHIVIKTVPSEIYKYDYRFRSVRDRVGKKGTSDNLSRFNSAGRVSGC